MGKNIEILKIINQISCSSAVNLSSIDMRVMIKYPEIIYNKELLSIINSLIDKSYLEWVKENSSVRITKEGTEYLIDEEINLKSSNSLLSEEGIS